MRPSSLLLPAALVLLSAGFASGWWFASRQARTEKTSTAAFRAATASPSAAASGPASPNAAAAPRSSPSGGTRVQAMSVEGLHAIVTRLKDLDPKAYAEAMAESEHCIDQTKRNLYRTALEISATSEQAAAYLKLYKEKRGLPPEKNVQDLRNALTYAGQREGIQALHNILKEFPDGVCELDSLIHGVALHDPAATVDWYNELPDDSKLRHSALIGMMYGLGQGGTDSGLKVFGQLNAEDQATCLNGFANAYCQGRGIAGADELLAIVPPELRNTALEPMIVGLSNLPEEEYLPWASRHLTENPQAHYYVSSAAGTFARRSPDAAFAWAETAAAESTTSSAASMVMAALVPTRPELVRKWVTANPTAPFTAQLRDLLPP